MNRHFRLAAVLSATLLSSAAMAVTPLTQTFSVNLGQFSTPTQSVTVTTANSSNFADTTSTVTTTANVAQFDTNTGILVGARASATTSVTTTAIVNATGSGGGRSATATANMTGTVSLAGTTIGTSVTQTATRSCSGNNCTTSGQNSSDTSQSATITGTNVQVANLAALAGTGNATFTQTATGRTSISISGNNSDGTASSYMTFGNATATNNSFSVTYSYYKFSNGSLSSTADVNSVNLNFGSVFVGDTSAAQQVRLTNLGDINTADLKLTSVGNSNTANYSTTLVPLSGLVAGTTSSPYNVTYSATAAGVQDGTLTLNLIDDVTGGVGMKPQTLTINVTGTGVGRANASFAATSGTTSASFDMGSRWILGGTQTTLNNVFSIYNTAVFGSAGLELVSITQDNTAAGFSLVPSSFGPIAAGSSQGFKLSINPASLGAQSSIFSIILRDYAPGVQGTPRQYTLKFTANAFVDEVPELSSWAMMIIGFGMVGAAARRRARSATAG